MEQILLITTIILSSILISMSRVVYKLLVQLTLSLLMVAIIGLDPVSVLIPIIFILGLVTKQIKIRQLGYPSVIKLYLFMFLFFSLLSCLWEPTWNWVIRFWSGVVFFYFINLFTRSIDNVRSIFFSVIFGTITSSIIALMSLLSNYNLGSMFFPVFGSFRFAGLYNATILGIFSAILILWLLDELVYPKLWKKWVVIKLLLIIMLIIQMLATLTRSAWLGFAVGLAIYVALEINKSGLIRKLYIIAGFIAVMVVALSVVMNTESAEVIRNRITEDSVNRSEDEEKRAKFYFTKNALDLAFRHPLGVGIGNTQKNTETFNYLNVGAHNNFVMVLSDMGWFAFIGFLLAQLYVVKLLVKKSIDSKVMFGLSAQMLLSCYVVLLVAGMYQDLLLYIPMWLIPSLAMTVLFRTRQRQVFYRNGTL